MGPWFSVALLTIHALTVCASNAEYEMNSNEESSEFTYHRYASIKSRIQFPRYTPAIRTNVATEIHKLLKVSSPYFVYQCALRTPLYSSFC